MHLPIELITMIVNEIDLINDLSSFSKVNRVFLELYQFNVRLGRQLESCMG